MTRLIFVASALALCFGCSKPKKEQPKTDPIKAVVKAPPEKPKVDPALADAPETWKEVIATHRDKNLSNEDKMETVDLFIRAHPDDPNIKKAKGLHSKLQRIVQREKSRERAKEDRLKYAKERKQLAEDMLRGSFTQLIEPMVYMGARRGASDKHTKKGEFSTTSLTLKTYPTEAYEHPVYIGITEFRESSEHFLRDHLTAKAKELCPFGSKCAHKLLNHLTIARVGKDLIKKPGTLDKDALALLLEEATFSPDAKLLGVSTKDAYKLLRPGVEVYIRVYGALNKVGLDKVKRDYKRALASRKSMLDFYASYIEKHDLYAKMGTTRNQFWPILSPVGFWMRRIGDGTAPLLVTYAKKQLATYEPDLADKL